MMNSAVIPFFRCLRKSIGFTLFATCFVTYAYFYQGGGPNEDARFDSIRAFVDNGNAIIDPWKNNSSDIIALKGHFYSSKAPGTFFLGLVPFWLTDEACKLLAVDVDQGYHVTTYATCVLSVSFFAALGVWLMYRLGLRLGASRPESATVALAVGLGTSFFPFATLFFSHVAAAVCALFAFYEILVDRQDRQPRRLFWAGGALGFAITLEYPAVIAVVLIGIYFLWTLRGRGAGAAAAGGRLVAGFVAGVLPLLIYNQLVFGNPFFVTYEAYADPASVAYTAHQQGVLGVRVPLWDWSAWPLFFTNLAEITYKPLRGLFFNNPVTSMVWIGFGLIAVARIRRCNQALSALAPTAETWLALAIFAAYLSFNACFGNSVVYWGGGASFGPRHLIVSFPFFTIPLLACLRSRRARAAFVPVAVLSVFVCLIATAVEPRTGYTPNNPLFFFYLPRFLTGLLAMNTLGVFSNFPLTDTSVAFNWGKLLHLPLWLQLTPLYAVWLLAMRRLDRQLGIAERGFFFVTGVLVFIAAWAPIAAHM